MDAFAVLAWISRLQPETHASGSGSSILCPHSPPDIPLLLMDHGCMARFFFRAPRFPTSPHPRVCARAY